MDEENDSINTIFGGLNLTRKNATAKHAKHNYNLKFDTPNALTWGVQDFLGVKKSLHEAYTYMHL